MYYDVHAEILPGTSLGGIEVGTPIADLQTHLLRQFAFFPTCKLVAPFEAVYSIASGSIDLAVDVRTGKIFKICAREGYRGLLFGTLHVGMNVGDAMSREPRLYYDEAEELLLIKGVDGIALEVPAVDPDPDHVPALHIETICVSIKNLMSASVQRGNW